MTRLSIKNLCKTKNLFKIDAQELTSIYSNLCYAAQKQSRISYKSEIFSCDSDLKRLDAAINASGKFNLIYAFGSCVGIIKDDKRLYDDNAKLYEGKSVVVTSENKIIAILYTGRLVENKHKNSFYKFLADDGNIYREAVFLRFEKVTK